MSLIIHKPAGQRVCPQFAQHVWQQHHGAWGMVRWAAGRAVVHRGTALDELQTLLARIPLDRPALVHLSGAAPGERVLSAMQPVMVCAGLHLMRSERPAPGAAADSAGSDAHDFARQLASVLEPLPKNALPRVIRSEGFARLLAPAVADSLTLLCDDVGPVALGRAWHTLDATHWDDSAAHGLQVSSLHPWLDASRAALRLVA